MTNHCACIQTCNTCCVGNKSKQSAVSMLFSLNWSAHLLLMLLFNMCQQLLKSLFLKISSCFQESNSQVQPAPPVVSAQYVSTEQDGPRSKCPKHFGLDCESVSVQYFRAQRLLDSLCLDQVLPLWTWSCDRFFMVVLLCAFVGISCVWGSYLVRDQRVWRLLLCGRTTLHCQRTGSYLPPSYSLPYICFLSSMICSV